MNFGLEREIVTLSYPSLEFPGPEHVLLTKLWTNLVTEKYSSSFSIPIVQKLLRSIALELFSEMIGSPDRSSSETFRKVMSNENLFEEWSLDTGQQEIIILLIGVNCLMLFIQQNFTGFLLEGGKDISTTSFDTWLFPSAKEEEEGSKSQSNKEKEGNFTREIFHSLCISALRDSGEDVISALRMPWLLLMSLALFRVHYITISFAHLWWLQRALNIHCRIMENVTESLSSRLGSMFEKLKSMIVVPSLSTTTTTANELKCVLLVEYAYFCILSRESSHAESLLLEALRMKDIAFNLTGELGKRLKFQSFDTSILKALPVHASSAEPQTERTTRDAIFSSLPRSTMSSVVDIPHAYDSNILSVQPPSHPLSPLEQSLLLLCVSLIPSRAPVGSVQSWIISEQRAYLDSFPSKSNSSSAREVPWCLDFSRYWLRSIYEKESQKTVDRASRQLEHMLHSTKSPLMTVKGMTWFFLTKFPSRNELVNACALCQLRMGAVKSAERLFEQNDQEMEIVRCNIAQGESAKAESILRAMKASREKISLTHADLPLILTALGDLTKDQSFYKKALAVSRNSYPGAYRSWGQFCAARRDFSNALPLLNKAAELNPFHAGTLWSLGKSAIEIEKWEVAISAFSRVVLIDPEDGNGWGNLGFAHLKRGNKNGAYSAFSRGVRESEKDGKMWENLLRVAVDIHRYDEAAMALMQIFELKVHESRIDWSILGIFVRVALDELEGRIDIRSGIGVGTEKIEQGDEDDDIEDQGDGQDEEANETVMALFDDVEDKDKEVDVDVVDVKADSSHPQQQQQQPAYLAIKVASLVTQAMQTYPQNPNSWHHARVFASGVGQHARSMSFGLKEISTWRNLPSFEWDRVLDDWKVMSGVIDEVIDNCLEDNQHHLIYEVVSVLHTVVKVGSEHFQRTKQWVSLNNRMQELENFANDSLDFTDDFDGDGDDENMVVDEVSTSELLGLIQSKHSNE